MSNPNICKLWFNKCKTHCGYVKEFYKTNYNDLMKYFGYGKDNIVLEPLLHKIHNCSVCGKEFSDVDTYDNHLNYHNNPDVDYCESTGEKYYDAESMYKEDTYRLFNKSFTCSKCVVVFGSHDLYMEHLDYCNKKRLYTVDDLI